MNCLHSRQKCVGGDWYCKDCGFKIPPKEPVDWSDGIPALFIGSGSEYFDVSLGRTIQDRHHRDRILKEENWAPVDERILKDAGEAAKQARQVKKEKLDKAFEGFDNELVEFARTCPKADPDA